MIIKAKKAEDQDKMIRITNIGSGEETSTTSALIK
jgi:hypothetical protein